MQGMKFLHNLSRLAGATRFLMFNALADALNQHHLFFGEGAHHLAALAFVHAGYNRNRVAFFNVEGIHKFFGYTTSGAREIIV